jgi:hypothetical protein
MASNRRLVYGCAALLVVIWTAWLLPRDYYYNWERVSSDKEAPAKVTSTSSAPSSPAQTQQTQQSPSAPPTPATVLPHVQTYFDQAFSVDKPKQIEYPGIKDYCSHVEFKPDVYIDCVGILAGMTSIISQVKVCFKMAIDSGSNLILPNMPLRDSKDLKDFNFLNAAGYMVYDKWFDVDHLRDVMARSCPQMKILHPKELKTTVPVAHEWEILNELDPDYHFPNSLFWVGKPYGTLFNRELAKLQEAHPDHNSDSGITVAKVDSKFLLFRITDDASGRDLRQWNDLSNAIRFLEAPRQITNRLVEALQLAGPYYGIHFRTENDTIWSGFDHQLAVDLDALDQAWSKFGAAGQKKPLVYLACGDEGQAERFVVAGAERGWDVTHKWKLLRADPETTAMVDALPFDFQGAVDLGIMVRSQFFFGITGSAFSSTISNLRDPTGRYRGSSFVVPDDAGARTHLFNDGNSDGYPCCL